MSASVTRWGISPPLTSSGFASVAKGNDVSFAVQEKRLRLVAEVARQVWGV